MSNGANRSQPVVVRNAGDERVEIVIGQLLRTGVLLAALVVLVGGAMVVAHYGKNAPNFRQFRGEDPLLKSVGSIARGVLSGDSRAIVQLGLVLLIATPVARVALTLGAFIIQRDKLYIAVTALVLALLLYGLFWSAA
ncbi:MAG TPA: DUF1634 domain-containing protein [Gemmatimonadaceae bacterium]|nr:DUF1634 domain-containing protein [Gemmatimonadaceae bacterium]